MFKTFFLKSLFPFIKNHIWILSILGAQFLFLSYWLLSAYFSSGVHVMDYGIEHQVLHNTAFGRWFQSSYEVSNYLGDHFSLIVLVFAPLYRIIPFGFTPILLQNASYVVGLFGLYKIGLHVFRSKTISTILVFFLSFFYPAISFLSFHYHPVVFSFPFIIWGIYYLIYKERLVLGSILLLVAMLGKEDVGLTIGFIILFQGVRIRNWKLIMLSMATFLYTYLAVKVFIPYFRGGPQDSAAYYAYLGSSLTEIVKNLMTDKKMLFDAFFHPSKIRYLKLLFVPLLFLPLFSKKFLFILIPAIAVNYLSVPGSNLLITEFHYDVITTALLFVLTLEGLGTIFHFVSSKLTITKKNQYVYSIIFASIIASLLFVPNYATIFGERNRYLAFITTGRADTRKYFEIKFLQSKISQNAVVLFDQFSGGFFGKFPNSKCYPGVCGEVNPVKIQDLDAAIIRKDAYITEPHLKLLQTNPDFSLKKVYETEHFELFTR